MDFTAFLTKRISYFRSTATSIPSLISHGLWSNPTLCKTTTGSWTNRSICTTCQSTKMHLNGTAIACHCPVWSPSGTYPLTGEVPVTSQLLWWIFGITFARRLPTPIFLQPLTETVAFGTNLSTSEGIGAKTALSTLLIKPSMVIISIAGGTLTVTSRRDQEESKTKTTLVITVHGMTHSGALPRWPPQLNTGLVAINKTSEDKFGIPGLNNGSSDDFYT